MLVLALLLLPGLQHVDVVEEVVEHEVACDEHAEDEEQPGAADAPGRGGSRSLAQLGLGVRKQGGRGGQREGEGSEGNI